MKNFPPKESLLLILLIAISAGIIFSGITLYPLFGDEYQSITSAKDLGVNIFNLIYFFLLNVWLRFGNSEFWLRSLSAIFGILSIVVLYFCVKKIAQVKIAIIAGFLSATSPFLVYHSQQVRFYSFFIFATGLFILASINFVNKRRSVIAKLFLLFSGVLLLLSHAFSILVISAQLLTVFIICMPKKYRKRAVCISAFILALLFLLPSLPFLRQSAWEFIQVHSNSGIKLEISTRPVSLINIAKVPFTLFLFTFGYNVYPLLNSWLTAFIGVIMILISFLCFMGTLNMFKINHWGYMPVIYLLVLLGVFFVADPLIGAWAQGLCPRHVAFAWPVFIILLSLGCQRLPKRILVAVFSILIISNLSSLAARHTKGWLYGETIDYRKASKVAERSIREKPLMIYDGQELPIKRYFPASLRQFSFWQRSVDEIIKAISQEKRIILVRNGTMPQKMSKFDEVLKQINKKFYWVGGYSKFPLLEYVFEQKNGSGFLINSLTGQVLQPLEAYGIEFKDIELPQRVIFDENQYTIMGPFSLNPGQENSYREVPLSSVAESQKINILSNVIIQGAAKGEKVAEMLIEDKEGNVSIFPIRLDEETRDWRKADSLNKNCETVYSWRKLAAFIGTTAYPGAWEDFRAGIYGVSVNLDEAIKIKKISFRYTAKEGQLFIWGLGIETDKGKSPSGQRI